MRAEPYFVAVVAVNAYFLLVALANIAYFRRATRPATVKSGPFVSVIIPARDEQDTIGRCVDSLLIQDYTDYEVIVVDDDSSDGTAAIVAERAERDTRLRLITAGPLPDGWLGKLHAMTRGAEHARGEVLLFTDADTAHARHSVAWAVTNLRAHNAEMLSGYLHQEYGGAGEGMVVPVIYLLMILVPFAWLPKRNHRRLAVAIGQYVAITRGAFDRIGGFGAVRDSIVDDMALAVRMKETGGRVVFLDAKRTASCRMFSCYRHACRGIKRCVYSAVGGSPLTVAVMAAVVVAFILAPVALVGIGLAHLQLPPRPVAIAIGLFFVQWTLIARDRDIPVATVALYPLVFANLLVLLLASMLRTGFGAGVEWKGRLVRVPDARVVRREAPAGEQA